MVARYSWRVDNRPLMGNADSTSIWLREVKGVTAKRSGVLGNDIARIWSLAAARTRTA